MARFYVILVGLILISSCVHKKERVEFDWQGHRGARGLMPENSIPGFLHALKFPVTTLELDLAVSKDNQLIVSHEPWFSEEICVVDSGDTLLIRELTARQIAEIDCGSKVHVRFLKQAKMRTHKPTLDEVINAVNDYCQRTGRAQPAYNIEIKSRPEWDGKYTPPIDEFTQLVLDKLDELRIVSRVTIQSFDPRVLNYVVACKHPVQLAFLLEDEKDVDTALRWLEAIPAIYSPHFSLLTKDIVTRLHQLGMRVIPWTVNDSATMRTLIDMGVDGIITDYPDLIEGV
jgi:glycerophosphoryl diester phosphodiesterase